MNAKVKQLWIDALRSGEYKQGKGALTNCVNDEHCCLGVLCQVAIKEGVSVVVEEVDSITTLYNGSMLVLPDVVRAWAELPEQNPAIWSDGSSLAEMNDDGRTFDEIADTIERHL